MSKKEKISVAEHDRVLEDAILDLYSRQKTLGNALVELDWKLTKIKKKISELRHYMIEAKLIDSEIDFTYMREKDND